MADEGILGRWSRLKRDTEIDGDREPGPGAARVDVAPSGAGAAGGDIAPSGAVAAAPSGTAAGVTALAASLQTGPGETLTPAGRADPQARDYPELPSLDSLNKDSDYSMFMRAEVEPGLRVSALKKLFADPRFNQMDGLDIYIDDYSKPDPLPLSVLKQLNQSRILGLFEDEAPVADAVPVEGAVPVADASQTVPPSDDGATESDAEAQESLRHGEQPELNQQTGAQAPTAPSAPSAGPTNLLPVPEQTA